MGFKEIYMTDDGVLGGDLMAGDGIYASEIEPFGTPGVYALFLNYYGQTPVQETSSGN